MITAMCNVMNKAYNDGLITPRDGNISLRRSLDGNISDYIYITPSGVRKSVIRAEDVVKMKINEESDIASIEIDMHKFLLQDATTTRAVVHLHPTYTIAAMYAGLDLQALADDFPEIFRYTKVGPTVAFHDAGSEDLAFNTHLNIRDGNVDAPIKYDIIGLENHGVTAVGKHPWDAYEHIERLEHICKIAMISR